MGSKGKDQVRGKMKLGRDGKEGMKLGRDGKEGNKEKGEKYTKKKWMEGGEI